MDPLSDFGVVGTWRSYTLYGFVYRVLFNAPQARSGINYDALDFSVPGCLERIDCWACSSLSYCIPFTSALTNLLSPSLVSSSIPGIIPISVFLLFQI